MHQGVICTNEIFNIHDVTVFQTWGNRGDNIIVVRFVLSRSTNYIELE